MSKWEDLANDSKFQTSSMRSKLQDGLIKFYIDREENDDMIEIKTQDELDKWFK